MIQVTTKNTWPARLSLEYRETGDTTKLCRVERVGPLVVQKALYPEGPQLCQTLILHPPGGIAGGDSLEINLDLKARSKVLVTMPGASKWYRTVGIEARQRVSLTLGTDAALEWLPPETIIFSGAQSRMRTTIALAQNATYLGWEIMCLGRSASGERFDRGAVHQDMDISIEDEPVWIEHVRFDAQSALLSSRVGLRGAPVSAVMVAAGKNVSAAILARCRTEVAVAPASTGITAMPKVLIARYVGDSCAHARRYFVALWTILRPYFMARPVLTPRIWNT